MREQVLDIALVLKSINGKIDGLTQQLDVVTKGNIKTKGKNRLFGKMIDSLRNTEGQS